MKYWPRSLPVQPVFANEGIAIHGTDPVAYFTQGQAVSGSKEFSADWRGAEWWFASAQNRDRFLASPEEYAPQYGGFCAWAVAEKSMLFSTQPENWHITDGKLYLNYNDEIQQRWQEDIAGYIAKGDESWPAILSSSK